MTLAQRCQLLRADEQVGSVHGQGHSHERDSWDVRYVSLVPVEPEPHDCFAQGCAKRAKYCGYCQRHFDMVRKGVSLDLEGIYLAAVDRERKLRKRRAASARANGRKLVAA